MLSVERGELEKSNEELLAKSDLLQTEVDEKNHKLNQLEEDYESLSLKVEAENDAQQEWEDKASKKAETHRKERAKLLDNLEVSNDVKNDRLINSSSSEFQVKCHEIRRNLHYFCLTSLAHVD